MADTAEQQPDPLTGSPPQKRKRGSESASPDARRSKRAADATAAAAAAVNTLNHGMNQGLDQAATAFMEVSGTSAPGGGDGDEGSGLTSPEFTAAAAGGGGGGDAGSGNSAPANVGTSASDAETSAALASSTAQAALGSMYPTLHVPQSTEETFANQHVPGGEDDSVVGDTSAYGPADVSNASAAAAAAAAAVAAVASQQQHQHASAGIDGLPRLDDDLSNGMLKRPGSGIQVKPAVGTDEWHKMRKDNHKEVERRRRETINEGINELAKIVPGCEKNKGSILQRAVVFITQLKENETQNIEKWTLEKLLTEQAIAELSASNDKLKAEVERLYRELETWKRVAQNAGLQPPEDSKVAEQPS